AQVVEVGLSGAQPLLGECKLRAILGAEAEDPEGERIELRGGKVGEQGKLARALAYLVAALSNQEGVMDEAADEGTAGRALGLRDLVLVMDRNMIHAAGMDIDGFAEVFHRHRRTFDVPSGVSASPRTVPLHQVMRLVEHPQCEVVGAFLVGRVIEALARVLLVEALAREPADLRSAP